MKKKIIILLGPPGVGKGSISQILQEDNANIKHVSIGSICREYALQNTELGFLIKSKIDKGELIDISLVEIIVNKVFENFLNTDYSDPKILILDGFPRIFEQTVLFLKLYNKYSLHIDFYVIFFSLDNSLIKKRLLNRYICSNVICDKIYSFNLYVQDMHCIKCSNLLYKRKDDALDIIEKRLIIYGHEEKKIIQYFKENKISFFSIDGNNTLENIVNDINKIVFMENNMIFEKKNKAYEVN